MPTSTKTILERDGYRCAYCGGRAIHRDHIVPIALRRRHTGFDGPEYQVASCGPCNWRKGTRRLAPVGFAIDTLPSSGWQVWDGGRIPEVLR